MHYVVAGMAVVIALAAPATAQDRTGFAAIATGDLAAAETTLQRERAIFPNRPELMLNLAAVYARTHRTSAARTLYGDVLAREAVALELPDGSVISSHDVARTGLQRLGLTLTAR